MKTESQEQIEVIQWCKRNTLEHPELDMIFAIPNGGKRHIATASRMKLEGVKPGVSDLFLSVARHDLHGLYIEMKREKSGKLSTAQKDWFNKIQNQGYAAVQANGKDQAIAYIKSYLNIKQ